MLKNKEGIESYSPIEEKINIITHATGLILSIVASVLLVTHANLHGDVWHIVSFSIFGASLIILYAKSAFDLGSINEPKGKDHYEQKHSFYS